MSRLKCEISYNARLRGWQRISLSSKTTTVTTSAHWDWKRRALTVPLEAFVKALFFDVSVERYTQTTYLLHEPSMGLLQLIHLGRSWIFSTL